MVASHKNIYQEFSYIPVLLSDNGDTTRSLILNWKDKFN